MYDNNAVADMSVVFIGHVYDMLCAIVWLEAH